MCAVAGCAAPFRDLLSWSVLVGPPILGLSLGGVRSLFVLSWRGSLSFCTVSGCILGAVCVHDKIPSCASPPFVMTGAGIVFRHSTRVCLSPIRGLGVGDSRKAVRRLGMVR